MREKFDFYIRYWGVKNVGGARIFGVKKCWVKQNLGKRYLMVNNIISLVIVSSKQF